jgi:hypothetical protein
MEKGLNSDLIYKDEEYHVQTEDWGHENPFVVTRVYKNGRVVKSVKTAYSDLLPKAGYRMLMTDSGALSPAVQKAIQNQHQAILDQLILGRLF